MSAHRTFPKPVPQLVSRVARRGATVMTTGPSGKLRSPFIHCPAFDTFNLPWRMVPVVT